MKIRAAMSEHAKKIMVHICLHASRWRMPNGSCTTSVSTAVQRRMYQQKEKPFDKHIRKAYQNNPWLFLVLFPSGRDAGRAFASCPSFSASAWSQLEVPAGGAFAPFISCVTSLATPPLSAWPARVALALRVPIPTTTTTYYIIHR